jgi:glycosyltransferase involved in cell wall biosynthesis
MKILHIISQAPDFTGSGKFIQEIVRQSQKRGHENFLLAGVQDSFEAPAALISKTNCMYVEFDGKDLSYPIPGMSDVMPYQSSVFSKLTDQDIITYKKVFRKKIQQAIEKFKPDILHAHHLWMVSAIARSVAPQIPMVTTCHGTCLRQHSLCPDLGKTIIKDLQRIDQIIALSNDQKQMVADTLCVDPSPIQVISGGYNKDCFFCTPKECQGVVELLYAGKIWRAKGVTWLLKSLAQIKDLPFKLHLAGDGSKAEKENCLKLAAVLKEKVQYHGVLSHDDLSNLMRRSHIFVYPSFFEGLPLVLMEALACGCRIITTNLPGVKELFGPKPGAMVKIIDLPKLKTIDTPFEKDKKDLVNFLAKTLKHSIEAVAKNTNPNREYIDSATSCYTWEKIFLEIEIVYNNVLNKGI